MVVGRWRTISRVLMEPWYTVSLGRGDSSKPIWMALRQASKSFPNRMACTCIQAFGTATSQTFPMVIVIFAA